MKNYNILFIKALRKVRVERGMTQEELANSSSINEKHYGRIERGECSPSLEFFFLICNALDVRPDKFIEYMLIMDDHI